MNPLDPALFPWRVRGLTVRGDAFELYYRTRAEAELARRLLLEPGSVPSSEIPVGFSVGKPADDDVRWAAVELRASN